ncbi:FK506-binding protein 15 [Pelomyxa schiedti]|nr:FK506-binding protein 15 [Pelomyxa schiedti]
MSLRDIFQPDEPTSAVESMSSFKYVPLKRPAQQTCSPTMFGIPASPATYKPTVTASTAASPAPLPVLLIFYQVTATKYEGNSNQNVGAMGLALVANTPTAVQLNLYKDPKDPLVKLDVTMNLQWQPQENGTATFTDHSTTWSIAFKSADDARQFFIYLCISKFLVAGSQFLVSSDFLPGKGKGLKTGDLLGIKYTGWILNPDGRLGELVETNTDQDTVYKVDLGSDTNLPGWNEGLIDVKRGTKRVLVMPSSLALGKAGKGKIPPNANLVYEVEVLRVKRTSREIDPIFTPLSTMPDDIAVAPVTSMSSTPEPVPAWPPYMSTVEAVKALVEEKEFRYDVKSNMQNVMAKLEDVLLSLSTVNKKVDEIRTTASPTTNGHCFTGTNEREELEITKKKLRETERKLLVVTGKKLKGDFCRFRGGELALADLNMLDLSSAIFHGGGQSGCVNSVTVLPQVTSTAMTLTPQPVEPGRRVALKMMLNYSAGIQSKQQKAFFDREAEVGLIYPHWCFCNIFSVFRADTKLSLIQGKHNYVLVDDNLHYVDASHSYYPEEVPVFNRTTYITMELGKYTLERAVAHTFNRCGAQQALDVQPLSHSQLLQLSFCLLCACGHLNSKGWYHCDIKLDNVLAMERPGVAGQFWALCDFGTSLYSANGEFVFPPGESFSGNAANRAPECHTPQWMPSGSKKYILGRNDVWAIGCVLYEAICGQHPYLRANQIDLNLLQSKSVGSFTVPSPSREPNLGVSALASYLLERDYTKRPSAKQAMLISGALMFLPPQALSQFATDNNKSAIHSHIWSTHEANVSAMEAGTTKHTPPTVTQLSSLIFTNKALKDLELCTSSLRSFLKVYSNSTPCHTTNHNPQNTAPRTSLFDDLF